MTETIKSWISVVYNFFKNLIFLDFSDYSGELPQSLIDMYSYFADFLKYFAVGLFLYFAIKAFLFMVTAGGAK